MLMAPVAGTLILGLTPDPPIPPVLPWGKAVVEIALRSLGEAPLPKVETQARMVRLVILPPFPSRRIVVVRLELHDDSVVVTTKALSNWSPSPGSPAVFPVRTLSPSKRSEIADELAAGLFAFHPAPFPDPQVSDGSAWYLEASGPRGHVAVIQHEPATSPFRTLCERILRMSGLDFTQDEFASWFGHL